MTPPRSSLFACMAAAALLLVGCASVPPEPATCPSDAEVAAKVQAFVALQPLADSAPGLTMDGAACGARKFVAGLTATQGKVVGYKAGLTTAAVQQRFGVNVPIRAACCSRRCC
jgi:2-keto-4-pentenoate hydratase